MPSIHPLLILCPGRLSLVWGTVPIWAQSVRNAGQSPTSAQFRVDCGACYDENAGVRPALHPKELT